MPTIFKELTIAAPAETVFTALTQQEEIVRWWADKATIRPEVGSLAEFRFRPPAGILKFEIAELHAGEHMR